MTDTASLVTLTEDESTAITNALGVAAERFDEHVASFRTLAEQLRAGGTMPLWAEGEMGAIAAERMATQFQLQAEKLRGLISRVIELGASFALVPFAEE